MAVRREIEIEAGPEDVWDALVDEEAREEWLDDDREVHVEAVEAPNRLVWWWWGEGDAPATRVEITIAVSDFGSRVVVTETAPAFPLVALLARFAPPAAVGRRAPRAARAVAVA